MGLLLIVINGIAEKPATARAKKNAMTVPGNLIENLQM